MGNAPAQLDMTDYLSSKSNHLTVEDFITGPRVLQIRSAEPTGDEDRPVAILFEGEPKAYLPAKTVRRVLARVWPEDSKRASVTYPGRWLRLYVDPDVTFGKETTGGIRIDGASHIDRDVTGSTVSGRNKRAPFRVEPIKSPTTATRAPKPTLDRILAGEKHLGPEVTAEVRTAYGAPPDADPATWTEEMQANYLDRLMDRAKGA